MDSFSMLDPAPVLVSLAGVFLAILVWRWMTQKRYAKPLPPGSLGLPFVGETLHFLHSMKTNRPWEFFESRERKYGPVFKTHLFGSPTVVVNPPDGLKLIFTNHNKLVRGSWPSSIRKLVGERSLFFMEGDEAKRFRHILLAFLGPEALQRYVGRTHAMIQKHVEENWIAGGEIKAYQSVKEALFAVIYDLFLSLADEKEQQELLEPFRVVLHALIELPIDFPGTAFSKAMAGRREIMAKLDRMIEQRRLDLQSGKASAQQDLLSVLLVAKGEDGRGMTDEEIKQNIVMLVLGGHDTSSSSLAIAIKYIAENPSCYDELRKEHLEIAASKKAGEPLSIADVRRMKYTWRVVQEGMRFVPPTTGVIRRAIVDFEMDGYTVPQGWQLFGSMYQSNKKEKFFPEAESFKPDRFLGTGPVPYSYIPFGGGPRMCPGYELAKVQDCVFLHHIVTRFKWSLCDPDEIVQMAPLAAPLKGLPIKLTSNPI
ncbi:cytochrome P450 716B2 [Selaginella moellendorffii]|nr:cytochrome P450 716B2 [Selaginella moellendorffii]|eukprot:XP_002991753.2 cytochrome P450 716B2 [Selaginella moellendorffii]